MGFGALLLKFKECVEKGMTRKEIQKELKFYHPCFVDRLAYIAGVEVKK